MLKSVIQRVCSIPELLDLIFGHLDPSSNANNAVVCKVWSEVARDKLWLEVCNLRQLLSILAPISTTGVSAVVVVRINNSPHYLELRKETRAKGLVSVYDIRSSRSQVYLRGLWPPAPGLYHRSRGDIGNQDEPQPAPAPSRVDVYHCFPQPEKVRRFVHERVSPSVYPSVGRRA